MRKGWFERAVRRRRTLITPWRTGDLAALLSVETGSLDAWNMGRLQAEWFQPAGFRFAARQADSGKMTGFLCGRRTADEAEILRLAVAVASRRRGVGQALLRYTLEYLRRQEASVCYLEVRLSNVSARRLYEREGFRIYGRRREYYREPVEDALLLRIRL